jgi:alginate O-acetyltransferase complex protein AlgI
MLFPTASFAIFFIFTLGLSGLIGWHKPIARNLALLLLSFLFYSFWNIKFLPVLIYYCLFNYIFVSALHHFPSKMKFVLVMGIVANLIPLIYFKYTYFILDILINRVGLNSLASITLPEIILPIGISFFSFHGISLLVDYYQKKIPFRPTLVETGMYLAFFPHQIAGPIVKAKAFIPQLRIQQPTVTDFRGYNFLILRGILKKVLIANLIGQYLVNPYFDNPFEASSGNLLLAIFFYAFQLYYDFSAYTDMAIGLAGILGYQFPVNFNNPYTALSIKEFWQKWHISLSSWLKDYLYIPLGGSRISFNRTLLNLIVVMMLGGLWHGANTTYFVWGLYHGLGLATYNIWTRFCKEIVIAKPLAWLLTFIFVLVGWVIFRSPDIETFLFIMERIANVSGGMMLNLNSLGLLTLLFLVTFYAESIEKGMQGLLRRLNALAYAIFCFILYVICFGSIGEGMPPFIYFQF